MGVNYHAWDTMPVKDREKKAQSRIQVIATHVLCLINGIELEQRKCNPMIQDSLIPVRFEYYCRTLFAEIVKSGIFTLEELDQIVPDSK